MWVVKEGTSCETCEWEVVIICQITTLEIDKCVVGYEVVGKLSSVKMELTDISRWGWDELGVRWV